MSRIPEVFARLRASGRRALIPFVVAGDPAPEATVRMLELFARAGADVVELGVPFSDPIADGPTNQRAAQRALAAGVTLRHALDLVQRTRPGLPVVLLSYYNPVLQYGLERFCRDAAAAGVDGVVVPDLPPDEADDLIGCARAAGIDTIFLLAPTSTEQRVRLVTERTTGFVYCVSLTGVTGARDRLPDEVHGLVRRVKAATALPVCVGFGVSTAEQARQLAEVADGVIVGSALVARLEQSADFLPDLEQFIRELRQAIDRVRV